MGTVKANSAAMTSVLMSVVFMGLYPSAKQTLRPVQQYQQEDHQTKDIAIGCASGNVGGAQALGNTQHPTTQGRGRGAAHSAYHHNHTEIGRAACRDTMGPTV